MGSSTGLKQLSQLNNIRPIKNRVIFTESDSVAFERHGISFTISRKLKQPLHETSSEGDAPVHVTLL